MALSSLHDTKGQATIVMRFSEPATRQGAQDYLFELVVGIETSLAGILYFRDLRMGVADRY
jgi:uncharacterized membrane protein